MRLDAEQSVAEASAIRLDPDRLTVALKRIAAAREVAQYHEGRAQAARASMAVLTRTWDLCPHPDRRDGFCCQDPTNCQGRQP